MVTGASSGLGLATAELLVALGAHVVLAVRDPARGEAAVRAFRPGLRGTTEVRRLDVADLSSVRAFAAATGAVDVLVANAGVMAVPFARSVDGHELQLATNHLGHFALALLLLPRLGDRVVVVSSSAHRRARLDLDDLDWQRRGYRPAAAYADVQAGQPALPRRAPAPADGRWLAAAGDGRPPRFDGDRHHRTHRERRADPGRRASGTG